MSFDKAFDRVIGHEGGYSNDPQDPGGETKFGISKRSYPNEDIKNLTADRAREIYLADFWNRLRCDDMPKPIAEFVFDFAVNSGVPTAAMALQAAVGALRDGSIGQRTIDALNAKPVRDVLRLLFVERAMVMATSPNNRRFGNGWFARLFDKTELALNGG